MKYIQTLTEKGKLKWNNSDAPEADGKFRDLSPKDLAAWLIKTRKSDMKKISGSLSQQVAFNQNDDKEYVKKMDKTRIEVYKQLDREDLLESVLNEEDTWNDYPAAAKKNAQKAIDWKEEHGRDEVEAGTPVGWARAHQLAKGENLSTDTVKRMSAFNRHRKNSSIKPELKETPWKDRGYVAWLIWGGDEGVDWAIEKSKEIDAMKESKQMKYIKPLNEASDAHYIKQLTDTFSKFKLPRKYEITMASIYGGGSKWAVLRKKKEYREGCIIDTLYIDGGSNYEGYIELKDARSARPIPGKNRFAADEIDDAMEAAVKHVDGIKESVHELRRDLVSGTMAGSIESLEDRKYELKKDVKDARIGNFTNVTLPKGTIIYNLPGGVFADHIALKQRYTSRSSQGPQYFDKPTFKGVMITSMPDTLAAIEKNSKVLESVNEAKMPKKYIGNDEIVFLKTKEDSKGAQYNLYYKGHDIEAGGARFGSEKELEDFAANYILSNQWYKKLRYEDSIPLPESIEEAKRSTVHKAAKKGSYPAVIVVVQDGKVIHQEPVSTPDIAPATFNVMQEKYPKALLHLEDNTGKRLFSESVVTEKTSLSEIKKITKTKEYKEILQATNDVQEVSDIWNMLDPKMFKFTEDEFEDIFADWWNDQSYDSLGEFSTGGSTEDAITLYKHLLPYVTESVVNEWGSSDQSNFNKSMHKEMGSPRKMPSPFDDKLRDIAADNVDHYWDDWDEYENDRDGLIDNAVRHYLRAFFKKDFEMMTKMFASNNIAEGLSKSAIKKAIKVIDKQIDTETGGDGEALDNETLQALEQERERLLAMNESKFSPLGYAKRVITGEISLKAAMKEAGISFSNISKLIKQIDKSFDLDAAIGENRKYVKTLSESMGGYEYDKWIKENGKIKYPKWITVTRKEIVKKGLMDSVYDNESQNMSIWAKSLGKNLFTIIADSKKREKEFGKTGAKFMDRYYNDIMGFTAISWEAATICLEIIGNVEDRIANGEDYEPAYYLAKEYFNSFGMDTKRSKLFIQVDKKLSAYMADNKLDSMEYMNR